MEEVQQELEQESGVEIEAGDVLEPSEAGKIAKLSPGDKIGLVIDGEEWEIYLEGIYGYSENDPVTSYQIEGWTPRPRNVANADKARKLSQKRDLSVSDQPNIRTSWDEESDRNGLEKVKVYQLYDSQNRES